MWQLILFFIVCFFLIIQQNYTVKFKLSSGVIFLFSVFLIIIAILRPSTLRDYNNYRDFFNYSRDERFEITAHLFRFVSPSFIIFLFLYAFIAITIKLYAIKENSSFHLLSIITYISTSYVLHDFIQIRVSCAIAIFLYSIKFLNNKKYIKYCLCIFIAFLFHKSALVFLIVPIFNTKKFRSAFWIFLILISYILYFLNFSILNFLTLFIPQSSYIIVTIKNHMDVSANVFNINQLIRIVVFIYFLFNLKQYDSKKYILLKVYAISIISLPFFGNISVLAYRLSEMLGTVIILLLPDIITVSKNKKVGYLLFLLFVGMLFFLNNIYNNFGF